MKSSLACCSLALCATLFSTIAAHAELIAHWPLDTDASDATGNGHDGALVGGTVEFGQPGANAATGTAARFPDNGHIDVPYDAALNPGEQAVDGSGSFTIALWANSSDNGGFNSPFTAREDNGTSVNGPIIYNNPDGNWSYWAGNNGPPGAWNAFNDGAVPLDTWQHVAIIYDSETTTRKMFVDGVEVINEVIGVSANLLRDIHIGSGQDDGNNFFWNGLIDDVGFWDEALDEATIQNVMENGVGSGLSDPRIIVPGEVEEELGATGKVTITVTNGGETQQLTISAVDISGDDAASFTVASLPDPIDPGDTGDIEIDFDARGGNGIFAAELEISSNDPVNGSRLTAVTVTVHDPKLVTDAELDFGSLPAGSAAVGASLPVANGGATRPLNITGVDVTGADAANFGADNFPASLAVGADGNIEVTFDPMGGAGGFVAQLEITSDDPVNPTLVVPVSARVAIADPLIAWWPLDVDSSDGTGNGFDGIDQGVITYGEPGANAATGGAAAFTGAEHIDVAWDPALNTPDFSVTLWANPSAAGGGSFRSPITNRDDVAPGGAFRHGWIIYNTNGGQWSFWNGGGPGSAGAWNNVDVGPVEVDIWRHLAITYDSATNTKNFYIDGTSVSTSNPVAFSPNDSTIEDGLTHEDEDLHIGGGGDTGTSFRWEGLIDDIGLFRTALTADEINTIMVGGVGGIVSSAPFAITSILRNSPTEVEITWNSRPGFTYAVDRAIGALEPEDWEEQDDGTEATGEMTTFVDSFIPEGSTDVFYRVRVVE